MVAYSEKHMQVYSFVTVTVHCMNFIIFLRVTLEFVHLTFTPILAHNPGDATAYEEPALEQVPVYTYHCECGLTLGHSTTHGSDGTEIVSHLDRNRSGN